jgi:hypothetical protein
MEDNFHLGSSEYVLVNEQGKYLVNKDRVAEASYGGKSFKYYETAEQYLIEHQLEGVFKVVSVNF